MIACVEKTAQNADFYQIIDFLTGCSINYSLLVDPDLIGPWLQQFWATASLQVINDVPSTSAPSPKSTSWEQFGTNIASALVEVVTALAAEEEHSTSPHLGWQVLEGIAQGSPTQSVIIFNRNCFSTRLLLSSTGTAEIQRMLVRVWYGEPHDNASIPKSPNGFYSTQNASQTSGGDEGTFRYTCFEQGKLRDSRAKPFLKAKQILTLKAKAQETVKFRTRIIIGRNKDEGTLSEEHYVQEEDTAHPFFDDIADKDAVTPDLERKSDETEEVNIEEKEASNVKSGETEELDLETTHTLKNNLKLLKFLLLFLEPKRYEHFLVLIQSQPQQPTQGTDTQGTDPKDKGKGILVEEPKKKKMTLQQIRALETTNDEEVARKIQAEWDAEEERKRDSMGDVEGKRCKRLSGKESYTLLNEKPSKKPTRISSFTEKIITSGILIHLWEILHVLDRQDLYQLNRVVDDLDEHISSHRLLGLDCVIGDLQTLLGRRLNQVMLTYEDKEEWGIIRWRFHEYSGSGIQKY
ncbi:hypothetical protein Tco_0724836 [Tanacetum coccineum]|uniref:Uncharacterized protein n=1 Tax=Tanacetum coccineum TaxID=301880 RepID=A0ABQ4YB84_9ASTR